MSNVTTNTTLSLCIVRVRESKQYYNREKIRHPNFEESPSFRLRSPNKPFSESVCHRLGGHGTKRGFLSPSGVVVSVLACQYYESGFDPRLG
ncbi:hypothetical protein AVEN_81924-1 [Araneus ventricosus]|uniref:Uncharacterized protein n=1 Tax=Araneus ventricosus TaxID=182803 RepID=A0A4Y2GIC7_ARAVE|nr:hypothetical protein AVEN_81924-1 [Araneus ventricosus]